MNLRDELFNTKCAIAFGNALVKSAITQSELSRKLCVNRSVVSRILSGRVGISAKMLVKLCCILKIDMKTLSSFID